MKRAVSIIFLIIVFGACIVVFLLRPAEVFRDPPRKLPWTLPDYRAANTSWYIGDDGRIYTEVEHFFLTGITPTMLSWFYQNLPIATVELAGRTLPLYHIFHPSEHGDIRVVKSAPGGIPGMAEGAVIERKEWFGAYDSQGRAEIVGLSDAGMVAVPKALGMSIGEIRHEFLEQDGGTAYKVYSVIGSEHPILGAAINFYLRKFVFHPQMLEQWRRHQVEEVASLQFFLPEIYAQRASGSHYKVH